jgi:hypothetical protein
MVFQKGGIPWNKGMINIYSKETLESNRQKHLGKKHSKKSKQKISNSLKGRKFTEEHKRKIGISNKGKFLGKTYEEIYGIKKAKEIKKKQANNWPIKMKGNFPKKTLEKKRQNMLGKNNPMFGIRGPNHPGWLGGKKFEPYSYHFNKHFKKQILIRDNYKCINCGITQEESKRLYEEGLSIHHIDYNKKNTNFSNCITLCHKCNAKANYNRNEWIIYFQNKIKSISLNQNNLYPFIQISSKLSEPSL